MSYKHFCSFIIAATLIFGSYRHHAGGQTGESTSYSRLMASFEGDYRSLDDTAKGAVPDRLISDYDHLIRQEAQKEGLDWRLLSAIAYHESRFDNTVVSPRGAKGIMQIMPATARQFDIPQERVTDPRTNVRLAAKLLKKIERSLRIPASTPFQDRMSIILACYNGGIGHVFDARRLASKYGADPNSWADVSVYLALKAQPAYGDDEVVECGSFKGSGQTLAFVGKVMDKYQSYCKKVQL